jgi:uncharacterized phiE125 gp8 family phage protein
MNYPYGYPYISRYDSTYDEFGTLRLTEGETPQTFTEPLDLTDVKNYLRIDPEMNDDDYLVTVLISAAREQAEILQGRDLVRKQYDLNYDYWPQYRVALRAPTVSVDLVQYKDLSGNVTTMSEGTDYVVDLAKHPAIITPPWNISWPSFTPWPSSAITIRFTSGYDKESSFWYGPGARLKAGMMMLISSWYEKRLPFETGIGAANEYPFAVTSCLTYGALRRPR